MKFTARLLLATLAAAGMAASATPSFASEWARHHPRQAQVLHREHHQLHQIARERRDGEISRHEAHVLRAREHRIAHEEHAYARAHGGRLTRGEQRHLNHEENRVHRAIRG